MRSVYFHEDDHCQVELLPISAVGHSTEEMARIDAFSNTNWDGHSWKQIYVRDDHSHYLVNMELPLARLEALVARFLTSYDEVLTGYASYEERCEHVRAWGDPEGFCLFASLTTADIIKELWLSNSLPAEKHLELWLDVLTALDELGGFVLADWPTSLLVRCSDREAMRRYLRGDHIES